jgi:hypothetical protein
MINHVIGDATSPEAEGHKLILHCCNNEGAWGAGFVLALTKKWPHVEQAYRQWFRDSRVGVRPTPDERVEIMSNHPNQYEGFHLGAIQVVDAGEDISVVNMIGQDGCGKDQYGHAPVRYYAIDECLKKVFQIAKERHASIHVPYLMCCGLAGGTWSYIEMMLNRRLGCFGVTAYEYQP